LDLSQLPLNALRVACELAKPEMIGEDIYAVLTLEGSVNARNHTGGTAPEQVLKAIAIAKMSLNI